jgi:hypothetical protein
VTQKRPSLRKGFENIKAHLKLSFLRDKYIPLKREYIKSLKGRSNTLCHLVKISKETPHLVHVSGNGYLYISSHGTWYSGIT